MRKCNYSKLDLARYLQNKMTRDEETEFQKHLITCSDCRDELECMRRAIKEIEQEPGSKKTWIIAAAIACSVAGGVCFSTFNPTRN
ncbi:MAG: zf-HC2 domain-containing protein, partial [Bacteroides sp.]